MTPDQIIEVVTAFKNGKKIECRNKVCGTWVDATPDWNFYHYDYRVKPEPMELWVNVYEDGSIGTFSDVRDAIRIGNKCKDTVRRAVLFREVLGAHDENGDK